jgi:hypothetical protein
VMKGRFDLMMSRAQKRPPTGRLFTQMRMNVIYGCRVHNWL